MERFLRGQDKDVANIRQRPCIVKAEAREIIFDHPFPTPIQICIMRGPADRLIGRRGRAKAAVSTGVDGLKHCC
ncbi:hypothetical protein, partial [Lysobacter capsici]|uniref:hypothetical protein n=1 Tax=Lysobacter capsici TaxID=435897 RepID=UPI001F2DBCB5